MNKADDLIDDANPVEHELRNLKSPVRGKYAERFSRECNVVMIAPDLTTAFPNEKAVNDALRFLLQSGKYPLPPSDSGT